MHTIGLVLHPRRDSAEAVEAVLRWAADKNAEVLGVGDEIKRLKCAATAVSARELGRRADLLVSLGGDGTMLRAMRLADGHQAPVLGVNLGKLGFLADLSPDELRVAWPRVLQRDYRVTQHLMFECLVESPAGSLRGSRPTRATRGMQG